MDTLDPYWIYESNTKNNSANTDVGKWMLFYPKDEMNDKWDVAKQLYRDGVLTGVVSTVSYTHLTLPTKRIV